MITLRQLHYFVTVADEGQLTGAARKLFVAQPALSQAIAQLEQQLGVRLLERHARGVSLTPAGDAFYAKAHAAVHAASEAELFARSLVRASSGALELGFMGTLPMVEAPELFAAFSAAAPEVDVLFHELPFPTAPLSGWIESVDIALCCAPTAHPEVAVRVLRHEPRVVLASARHPLAARPGVLSVADVLDERFVGMHPSVDPAWMGVWRLDDHRGGPAPHVSPHRTNSQQEVTAVVLSGRAIAVTPALRARDTLGSVRGLVAMPLADADPIELTLVWRADNRNPLLAALLDSAAAIAEGTGAEPASELRTER
jgi:DNA-binding transcriptional LysR family regulator